MKAVVHIGAPKTGSSTIQEFLRLNADELAARGVHYDAAGTRQKSQLDLPIAALAQMGKLLPSLDEQLRYGVPDLATQRTQGEAAMTRIATLIPSWSGHLAIFSSEHIHPWLDSVDAIRTFDAMMRAHFDEVRYVLYIRNQEDLILSLYSQDVKNGGTARLNAYFNRILPFMDLEKGVMRWLKSVGRDRFELRLLDRDFLEDGDLLADFALTCGFSLDGLTRPAPQNESMTAPAAELLRTMNARIPRLLPEGGVNPLAWGLEEQVILLSGPGPRLSLTEDQRERLHRTVADGNEMIRKTFFPERERLFSVVQDIPALGGRPMAEALDMAVRMIIRLRMGDWQVLSDDDRKRARRRSPAENSSAVASSKDTPISPLPTGAAEPTSN